MLILKLKFIIKIHIQIKIKNAKIYFSYFGNYKRCFMPILSREFNSRAQVDLVDMQPSQQGQLKWIMVYQCKKVTKVIILRAVSSKIAAESPISWWTFSYCLMLLISSIMSILSSKSCGINWTCDNNTQDCRTVGLKFVQQEKKLCSSCWHQPNPIQLNHVWRGL